MKKIADERIGTWDQLKLHPTTLVRLVIEDKADVIGKDKHGRIIYRLREEGGEIHGR